MALAGTEFIYSDTVIDPADTRLAAIQAVSRCTPDELPMVLSMLGLDVNLDTSAFVKPYTHPAYCQRGHLKPAASITSRSRHERECQICRRERNARFRAKKRKEKA